MDEEQKKQHPLATTRWEKVVTVTKHEVRWLAETLGMVTVTLAIGRLIQKLGLDVSHLTGTSWEDLVKKWLQQEERP